MYFSDNIVINSLDILIWYCFVHSLNRNLLRMTEMVTPGDVLGNAAEFKAGKGAYVNDNTIYASLTGSRRVVSPLPDSLDQVSASFTD